MVNVEVKEFKIKLNGIEYIFRLDFKGLLKFTNRYENGVNLFNDFLNGGNIYDTCIKILSCCVRDKKGCSVEMSADQLEDLLAFDFNTMKLIDDVTLALIEGVFDKTNDGIENKKK